MRTTFIHSKCLKTGFLEDHLDSLRITAYVGYSFTVTVTVNDLQDVLNSEWARLQSFRTNLWMLLLKGERGRNRLRWIDCWRENWICWLNIREAVLLISVIMLYRYHIGFHSDTTRMKPLNWRFGSSIKKITCLVSKNIYKVLHIWIRFWIPTK